MIIIIAIFFFFFVLNPIKTYSFSVGVVFGWDVSQSLDLQHPGRVKNRRQLFVGDADLAIVHETQQGFHVTILDIAQDDDRMLARIRLHQRMDQFIRKTCCIGLVFATLVFFYFKFLFSKKILA